MCSSTHEQHIRSISCTQVAELQSCKMPKSRSLSLLTEATSLQAICEDTIHFCWESPVQQSSLTKQIGQPNSAALKIKELPLTHPAPIGASLRINDAEGLPRHQVADVDRISQPLSSEEVWVGCSPELCIVASRAVFHIVCRVVFVRIASQ